MRGKSYKGKEREASGVRGKERDHTEFMVLALQRNDVYGESMLGFPVEKVLADKRIARIVWSQLSCQRDFL